MNSLLYFAFGAGVTYILLQQASSARIDVSPDGFIEGVTEYIFISCTPDGTGIRAKEILVIQISIDGDTPIVHIQPPDRIQYGTPISDHYEAQGLVSNSYIPDSYLNLTIKYPSKDDAGTYKCAMSYIDELGLLKQDISQADLRLNVSDHSNLEIRINNLEAALKNLLVRITNMEKDNMELHAENRNHTSQIRMMTEKLDYVVAFSAAISEEKHITTGDVLVFSDVMINEGQGYNATNGIFTAPAAGLYYFQLVLEIGQGGTVGEIYLNVAGTNVAKMYVQDKDFGDQGSIAAVSRLKAGDEVKVVVFLTSGNNPRVLAEHLCVFSGYLITP